MCILEKNNNRVFAYLFIVLLLWSAGCGSEEERNSIGERLSGPTANSALPMRVDETPTPTPTTSPQDSANQQADAQNQPAESEGPLDTATPTPEMTPLSSSPGDEEDEGVQQDKSPVAPTPTPTSTLTPRPTPSSPNNSSSTKKTATTTPGQEGQTTSERGKKDEKKSSQSKGMTSEKKTARTTPAKKTVEKKVSKNAQSTISPSQHITLVQAEVCSKISNRQPSGSADTFSFAQVKRIYTWMKVSGVKPPAIVKHIYYRNGKIIATVKLKLKYPAMRTWSKKTFKGGEAVGKWKVLITTSNEKDVLAVKKFTVTP